MFGWFTKKRVIELEKKTQDSFSHVKKDINVVSGWIKHLDRENKRLFDMISLVKEDLSSLKDEIGGLREGLDMISEGGKIKQVFKKLPVFDEQTGVRAVQKAVQTPVQTAKFYDILKSFSQNERVLIFTLLNSDLKLSYEDLALLLGKERSTIRGRVNSIRQKSEGLIQEVSERNGKKRVFIPDEIKVKMQRFARVREKRGNMGSGRG